MNNAWGGGADRWTQGQLGGGDGLRNLPRAASEALLASRWLVERFVHSDWFAALDRGDWVLAIAFGAREQVLLNLPVSADSLIALRRAANLLDALNAAGATLPEVIATLGSTDRVEIFGEQTPQDFFHGQCEPALQALTELPLLASLAPGWEFGVAEAFAVQALRGLRLAELRRRVDLIEPIAAFLGGPREAAAIARQLDALVHGDAEAGLARIHGNRNVLRCANLEAALERRCEQITAELQEGTQLEPTDDDDLAALTRDVGYVLQSQRIDRWVDEALRDTVGLGSVRTYLRDLCWLAAGRAAHRAAGGVIAKPRAMHLALLGQPGVGKTMVARRYAKLLFKLGLVQRSDIVEVGARELIGRYIGATTPKVQEIARSARGGVLFIDEAYALVGASSRDFGHEAVAALLQEMDRAGPELTVVVAGYAQPLLAMLHSNPGLASRISARVELGALSAQEAGELLLRRCAADGVEVEAGVLDVWLDLDLVVRLPATGRAVEDLYDKLQREVISPRAVAHRRRFQLKVRDLAELRLPQRRDLDRAALLLADLDDAPN